MKRADLKWPRVGRMFLPQARPHIIKLRGGAPRREMLRDVDMTNPIIGNAITRLEIYDSLWKVLGANLIHHFDMLDKEFSGMIIEKKWTSTNKELPKKSKDFFILNAEIVIHAITIILGYAFSEKVPPHRISKSKNFKKDYYSKDETYFLLETFLENVSFTKTDNELSTFISAIGRDKITNLDFIVGFKASVFMQKFIPRIDENLKYLVDCLIHKKFLKSRKVAQHIERKLYILKSTNSFNQDALTSALDGDLRLFLTKKEITHLINHSIADLKSNRFVLKNSYRSSIRKYRQDYYNSKSLYIGINEKKWEPRER